MAEVAAPAASAASAVSAPSTTDRNGLWAALLAYGLWGIFPLYFQLTKSVPALEVVAHRVVWSAFVVALLLLGLRRLAAMRQWLLGPVLRTLSAAAVLLGVNWGTYVWAVTNGHTVDASLGYFLNPLLSVGLGVLFLGERQSPLQWAGVACAALGVAWLGWSSPQFPWVALVLAGSFALYGFLKKRVSIPPLEGMLIETLALLPLALGVLLWLQTKGALVFAHQSRATDALLWSTGLVTTVPLLAFAFAAQRLPLALLGMLQYMAPTMVFLIGVWLLHEPMDMQRLAGFGAVWAGLILFTLPALSARWQRTATGQRLNEAAR